MFVYSEFREYSSYGSKTESPHTLHAIESVIHPNLLRFIEKYIRRNAEYKTNVLLALIASNASQYTFPY